VKLSICTTNYNCAHAIERHLVSIYHSLAGLDFEYIVVDNHSQDESRRLFEEWARSHPNMSVLVRRCTMGSGRQIAFEHSSGRTVMVVDTDVVYNELFRRFVDAYFANYSHLSLQAVYCGLFPREQWLAAGGRRSLNTNEDVDLWVRIARLGSMRWYPIPLGDNLKDPDAWGRADHLSSRYTKSGRMIRLLRREWDLFKTRDIESIDLDALIRPQTIDLELGPKPGRWPQNRSRRSGVQHLLQFAREFKQTLELG